MLDTNTIEDLDKMKKERKENYFLLIVFTAATVILAYLNFMPLALGSLIIAIISHTNLRYWDIKYLIIKYSSTGGKTK